VPAAELDQLISGLPLATVVKVPHHGSRGSLSPAFYAALSAKEAVISVGANNSFGHPHPALIKTLEKQDIRIWRTDQQGAITISSNGRAYDVQTFKTPTGHETDH
jgi:competence protein ComEC